MHETKSLVLLVLTYLFAGGALVTYALEVWSARWPTLQGTVDSSYLGRGPAYEWEATNYVAERGNLYVYYSYTRDGVTVQASRLRALWPINWDLGTSRRDQDLVNSERYRTGSAVKVYYCPLWPRWVCLKPGGYLPTFVLAVAAFATFLMR